MKLLLIFVIFFFLSCGKDPSKQSSSGQTSIFLGPSGTLPNQIDAVDSNWFKCI